MIDLTLDKLKRPAITGLVPSFGTTVEVTEKNKGGLSTTEVDANMALAYELQREVNVSTSDTTSIVEHDAKVALIGDEAITLTLQGASYGGCELKITNRGSQTATILYNEGASIQIPPRGYLRFIWTLQDWWVEQRRNPQEDGGNIQTYTYVVDSDQALIDWANNDRNSGQDYTSVLIKRGTWTSTIGVNLTNAGTKVVVGEADSKLVFNGVEKCLYYDTVPETSDYYIRGIEVEATATFNLGDNFVNNNICSCFYNCTNIISCTGTATAHGEGNVALYINGCGFYNCTNITNCSGSGTATAAGTYNTRGYGSGFYSCINLTNCSGSGVGSGKPGDFSNDESLSMGFYSCINLTNCTGIISVSYNNERAFNGCDNITNCTGIISASASRGYAFAYCHNISNCRGTGYIGFSDCYTVIACKAGGKCGGVVFQRSYASNQQNSTYACADTANGGFNNTTNPSA